MNQKKIIVGTRGSALALKQTQQFVEQFRARHPQITVEIKTFVTTGDKIQDRFLNEVGGKGLFIKELEEALLSQEIDFAVHSLKDLPADLADGLKIACIPLREESCDVLISPQKWNLSQLPHQAIIGTSSLRRRMQLEKLRPDLKFEMLRGNIDTRLRKLAEGKYDAIILAKAGMKRLGVSLEQAVDLPTIPAPGQGALAIEARQEDEFVKSLLQVLHDENTALKVETERYVMRVLAGDCNTPLGVLATVQGEKMVLEGFYAASSEDEPIQDCQEGLMEESRKIADKLVSALLNRSTAS